MSQPIDPGSPFARLANARALAAGGQVSQAALELERALSQPVPYAFFPRAEKLIAKLADGMGAQVRQCRIAVLGPTTTSLLVPILKAFCLRDRIRANFYEGLYGSVRQEILDPESRLKAFRPDIVFLVAHWREMAMPGVADDESALVDGTVEQQQLLWQRLADQYACHVVQFAFDFPAQEPYGYLARALPGGRLRAIDLINLRLGECAPSHVSILDAAALQRQTGLAVWQNELQWHTFQQHPSSEALPVLADAMLAHVRAVLGLTRKVLITDLDNTLWKGIIGEEGLQGIEIGPGSAAGEAHRELQRYMLDLKSRGVLLAVASKNNHEDACLPFEKHPHMLLRLADFAAFEANWNDKAASIREIARKLSLGLDSFVFLDDNPLEREWVRSQLPGVAVVELGASVFDYVRDLDRTQHFFALSLSVEDQERAEQYRREAERKEVQAASQSLDEFLTDLELRASVEPVDETNLVRVTQLTNKTNQFNLTTRRYTEAQVRQLAQDPKAWTAAFRLSDRLGEYGLIGVIFCRAGAIEAQWNVDTWLMSCRVLGRQMEKFMLDRLIEAAQFRGIREITGTFRPTAKNALVKDHYDQLGFQRSTETGEEINYWIAVPGEPVRTATHVSNVTESERLAAR